MVETLTRDFVAELEAATTRRAELLTQLAAAQADLSHVRGELFDGKATAHDVSGAQSLVSALESALSELEERIRGVEADLSQERARADHSAKLDLLKQLAEAETQTLADFETFYRQTCAMLENGLAAMYEKMLALRLMRQEFASHFPTSASEHGRVSPAPEAESLLKELRATGVDLTAIGTIWDGQRTVFDATFPNYKYDTTARCAHDVISAFDRFFRMEGNRKG